MNFRVYVIIEAPILDNKFELLIPIDRRIYEVIDILKKVYPDLSSNYYKSRSLTLYNKASGKLYDMNDIIKDTEIKTGTRLVLI